MDHQPLGMAHTSSSTCPTSLPTLPLGHAYKNQHSWYTSICGQENTAAAYHSGMKAVTKMINLVSSGMQHKDNRTVENDQSHICNCKMEKGVY